MSDRKKALDFATRKHAGQLRKDGKDYITHPIAVAEIALAIFDKEFAPLNDGEDEDLYESLDEERDVIYILSILHDVYEDTDTTLEEIEELFNKHISERVHALSRIEPQNYYEFTMNIKWKWNRAVKIVKRADLTHNMSDLKEGSLKDKYRFAEHLLKY